MLGTIAIYEPDGGHTFGTSWKAARTSAKFYEDVPERLLSGNDTITNVESDFSRDLQGYAGNDLILASSHGDDLYGGVGNDTLKGGSGEDGLYGSEGRDKLSGGRGNDILQGSYGDDVLDGGAGADDMQGNDGNDTFYVDSSRDETTEDSDQGIDTVISTASYQLYNGGDTNWAGTTIGDSIEVMRAAGSAAISLIGNELVQKIIGNAASNVLNGRAGKDTLSGNGGNDTLIGGIGRDIQTGGAGRDKFDFNAVNQTGITASTRDIIKDFTRGYDKIDLSTIDANGTASGSGRFTFVRTEGAAFTGVRGQLTFDQQNATGTQNDKTIVLGDVDGDARADFAIELTGIKALSAGDFVL